MRILIDANVLVSALGSHGRCELILARCRVRHRIVCSEFILDEVRRVLTRGFGVPPDLALAAVSALREGCEVVDAAKIAPDATRDPKDLPVLGAAVSGRCDCLVTGDKDLLVLGKFRDIPILSPREFWRFEAEFGS